MHVEVSRYDGAQVQVPVPGVYNEVALVGISRCRGPPTRVHCPASVGDLCDAWEGGLRRPGGCPISGHHQQSAFLGPVGGVVHRQGHQATVGEGDKAFAGEHSARHL